MNTSDLISSSINSVSYFNLVIVRNATRYFSDLKEDYWLSLSSSKIEKSQILFKQLFYGDPEMNHNPITLFFPYSTRNINDPRCSYYLEFNTTDSSFLNCSPLPYLFFGCLFIYRKIRTDLKNKGQVESNDGRISTLWFPMFDLICLEFLNPLFDDSIQEVRGFHNDRVRMYIVFLVSWLVVGILAYLCIVRRLLIIRRSMKVILSLLRHVSPEIILSPTLSMPL
jgi:hypothetical protein